MLCFISIPITQVSAPAIYPTFAAVTVGQVFVYAYAAVAVGIFAVAFELLFRDLRSLLLSACQIALVVLTFILEQAHFGRVT